MRCEGFPPEQYGLYPLGSLDTDEASQIAAHLDQRCETCLHEVRSYIRFWSQFGEALSDSPEKTSEFPAYVLPFPSQKQASRPGRWATTLKMSAAAAVVLLAAGLGYWFQIGTLRESRIRFQSKIAHLEKQIAQLSRQKVESGQATQAAPKLAAPAPARTAVSAGPSSIPSQNRLSQLDKALAEAKQQYEGTLAELGTTRAQVSRLELQLSRQQSELAEARTAQQQLGAQIAAVTTERRDAETRVRTLETEVRQLTQAKERLTNALQLQEMRAEQSIQLVGLLSRPGTRLVALRGTESAPSARGYALAGQDGRLVFFTNGLPNLPAGRVYQLWLMRGKGDPVVSGGVFEAGSQRPSQVEFNEGNLLDSLRALAVTDEPTGGSRLPTGRKMLVGTIQQS